MEIIKTHALKIIVALLAVNLVATGYMLTVIDKHQQAFANIETAMGQIANAFIQSRLVERGDDGAYSVNKVITEKDLQQEGVPMSF